MANTNAKPGARGENRAKDKRAETAPRRTSSRIIVTEYDPVIFICVFILSLIGIVMVFSSSYYTAMRDPNISSMYYFLFKQAIAGVIGFLAMVVMATINYHALKPLVPIGYAIANGLLVLVKFIGADKKGAVRWIDLPIIGFSFQPSEFAKAMVILALAFYLSGKERRAGSFKGLLTCAAIIGLPCALVAWGNNMSTAIIIVAIGFGVLFVSSPQAKKLLAVAGAGAGILVAGLWYQWRFGTNFRGDRFGAWLDPWSDPSDKGYQIINSLYAVASGGLFGLGLGQSRQKLKYLPEPQNDFIFAIICEELGFFGAAVVLLLFGILIWRGVRVALLASDLLGCLIATGITVLIGVQVIINVAVVTNTIPNTGIPLPFISYGGTSIILFMGLMGVLMNVSRYTRVG